MKHVLYVSRLRFMAAVFCALVAYSLGLPGPALAIGIYDAQAAIFVRSGFGPPAGTSFGPFTGSTVTAFTGSTVSAFATTFTEPSLLGAHALVFGTGDPFSASFASAVSQGALLNENATPVDFPLIVELDHDSGLHVGAFPSDQQKQQKSVLETASAHFGAQVLFDGAILWDGDVRCTSVRGAVPQCEGHGTGSTLTSTFLLPLTPGFHPLVITAEADGSITPAVVPEPSTLLLVGTTAAGLGLARWRQRRRKQAARTP